MTRNDQTSLFKSLTGILILCLALVLNPIADAIDNEDTQQFTPSETHQKLANAKAMSHLASKEARRMAAYKTTPFQRSQASYDMQFYDIRIRIDDTTEIIYGHIGFVARATESGVNQIDIDLHSSMTVDSVVASSGQLVFSRNGDVVTLSLDQLYNLGDQFAFDFYYHGHPVEGGFQAFAFDLRYGKKVISTLSEPYFARTWWPCKDRMDDKADSFNIAIEMDTSFYVASNGTLDSIVHVSANTNKFYYSVRYPMVTYLFSIAASDYTVWQDEWVYNGGADTMPIVNAVYPDRYAYSLTKFDITPNALTVLSDLFGEYPFASEKYGHANFEWGGAMEHQTMTSATGSNFGFSQDVVVHEMAHQWWGDMITCESWSHIWLNEGWASYAEALYRQAMGTWADYHSHMAAMDYSGGGTIYVQDTTSVWNIFSLRSYDKGAWVLHMLRGLLGDSLFWVGVHAYYNSSHQHAAATTEDFRDVFEAATGMELDWFFQDWIYGTFRPNYHWSIWEEPSDSGGYDLFLRVNQVQTTDPLVFRMPVEFYFKWADGSDDTLALPLDERARLFKFNFVSQLDQIRLDPSNWVLNYDLKKSWQLFFVTLVSEISSARQYASYIDTIQTRGGTGTNTLSVVAGALPAGIAIDNNGVLSGSTVDTGTFEFTLNVDDNFSSYSDQWEFTLRVDPAQLIAGDLDFSGDADIVDFTFLVDYLFASGPPPVMLDLADVDASCEVDLLDLTYFVGWLFENGPPPQIGCVGTL
ncbi:MAG: M1 family aminopeptidase [Candidatus Zixiibacteriota bacterium]